MRKFNNYDLAGEKPVLAWNPLAMKCTPVGEGCRNCWHLKAADRLSKNPTVTTDKREAYAGLIPCAQPLAPYARIPSHRVIAVQFMGDLWHETVPQFQRDMILTRCIHHAMSVFLLLTKRPECVREQIPPNCWMGVSAWDQASFERNMFKLEGINAKNKWISLEPLIQRIDAVMIPEGLGFIAVGPETVSGKERECKPTTMFLNEYGDMMRDLGIAVYDKRRKFTVREWPEQWKK